MIRFLGFHLIFIIGAISALGAVALPNMVLQSYGENRGWAERHTFRMTQVLLGSVSFGGYLTAAIWIYALAVPEQWPAFQREFLWLMEDMKDLFRWAGDALEFLWGLL